MKHPTLKLQTVLISAALTALAGCASEQPQSRAEEKVLHQLLPPASPVPETESAPAPAEALAEPMMAEQDMAAGMAYAAPARAKGKRQMTLRKMERAEAGGENYQAFDDNSTRAVADQPVSTFSVDVDVASYANSRRFLSSGNLPPLHAVRTEEFINYFDYNYPGPDQANTPFRITTEVGPTPWNQDTLLLHIGIKGYAQARQQNQARNLVFLLDVSGSMSDPDKLPLLKKAMHLLVNQLNGKDKVSIAVYAGASGLVLEPTAGNQHDDILDALDRLQSGGSTNGGAGIRLAYRMARKAFIKDGINRVILATDGDFNVGTTGVEELKELVEHNKQGGIGLTVLGFGQGNYNDYMLEQVSNAGDANAAYIDSLQEAEKVLVHDLKGTLNTIARDTKIQVEFNPVVVAEYRLLGYENRILRREDFNNDKVDAGDVGEGHTVTAIYEIALAGGKGRKLDALRYGQEQSQRRSGDNTAELAFVKLRYKRPGEDSSRLMTHPVLRKDIITSLSATSDSYRFSAAVAAFAQKLRNSNYQSDFSYTGIRKLAAGSRGSDPHGVRGEFLRLVDLTRALSGEQGLSARE